MGMNQDEAKGRVKQAVGDLTDNDDLKSEGKADKAVGKTKGVLNDAENKAEQLVDKVRDAVDRD